MAMRSTSLSHVDLARSVHAELNRRNIKCPSISVLERLFAVLSFASLKTEEGQPINAHIVYLNPKNPDPFPPETIRPERWQNFSFSKRIELTVSNLVKLAKASDPRTSSFAVFHEKNGKLFIWGMVDQGNSYHEFVNLDCSSGFSRPGVFQATGRARGGGRDSTAGRGRQPRCRARRSHYQGAVPKLVPQGAVACFTRSW